jgi:hypothetical protein
MDTHGGGVIKTGGVFFGASASQMLVFVAELNLCYPELARIVAAHALVARGVAFSLWLVATVLRGAAIAKILPPIVDPIAVVVIYFGWEPGYLAMHIDGVVPSAAPIVSASIERFARAAPVSVPYVPSDALIIAGADDRY